MTSTTRLRVWVCALGCVLGGATAFLAFTSRGLLVLLVAFGASAGLALVLRLSRPDLFVPPAPARLAAPQRQAPPPRVVTANAKGVTSRPIERRQTYPMGQRPR